MRKLIENILKQLSSKIGDNIMSNPNIISNDAIEGIKDINLYKNKLESNEEIEEKWSEKYKRSIDCKNPKGFSQRAHCQGKKKKMNESETKDIKLYDLAKKYSKSDSTEKISKMYNALKRQLTKGIKVEMVHDMGMKRAKKIAMDHLKEDPRYYDKLEKIENKEATGAGAAGAFVGPVGFNKDSDFVKKSFKETPKKIESNEATGAASAGAYDAPGFEDVKMKGNHERGSGKSYKKTQIPGGKFVQVKKKCKKFPYCNQGDIKALNIFENETLGKVIKDISKKYNISEQVVKNIIEYEYNLIKDKL
jgi:Mor family transcriptional regulator